MIRVSQVYGHEVYHLFNEEIPWNTLGRVTFDLSKNGTTDDVPMTFTYGGQIGVVGGAEVPWVEPVTYMAQLSTATFLRVYERLSIGHPVTM